MMTPIPLVILVLVAATFTDGLGTVRHGQITLVGRYRWQFIRSFDNEENDTVTEKLKYKSSTVVSYSEFRRQTELELEKRREKFISFTLDPPYVTRGGDDFLKTTFNKIVSNKTEYSEESWHSIEYEVGANDSPALSQLCFDGPGVTLVTNTIARTEDQNRYNLDEVNIWFGYVRAATPEEQAHSDLTY